MTAQRNARRHAFGPVVDEVDEVDIERAAQDPVYRRKVIDLLNREPVDAAAAATDRLKPPA